MLAGRRLAQAFAIASRTLSASSVQDERLLRNLPRWYLNPPTLHMDPHVPWTLMPPNMARPWLSAQRRSVTFLRATHAHGEKQGCYNDIEMKVTNFKNEDKGTTLLAGDVFDVPIRRDIVHRVVVWQLAKRRQGTHSTKTISEVSGTGRKPYKQKGTGQARHGTLRGPQFRHGATMHGPKPRDYSYNLPKKVRRLGLKIALSARVAEGKLLVFEDVIPSSHKTKDMANFIAGLEHCKRILIVDGADKVNTLLHRSTGNLYAADVLPAQAFGRLVRGCDSVPSQDRLAAWGGQIVKEAAVSRRVAQLWQTVTEEDV